MDLRGKIAAKFLIRSHFPQYKTISQKKYHIKRGAIQKLCRLHNGIFHPMQLFATLSQFYSNTSTVLFTKLHLETIDEKKEDFSKYGCFNLSRYIEGGKKSHLETQLNF